MNDDLQAMKQSQAARRENLAKWRAGRRHELTLPSGLPVVVKDASITDLMLAGEVPQTLMAQIMASAEGEKVEIDLQKFAGSPDFGALVSGIVKVCLVEPAVAEKSDDDHITLAELSGEDRMALFQWSNREAAPFRGAPGQAGAAPQPVDAAQPG